MQSKGASQLIVDMVEKLSPQLKRVVWDIADLFAFVLAIFQSYFFFHRIIEVPWTFYLFLLTIGYLIYRIVGRLSLLDSRLNRYSGIQEFIQLFFLVVFSLLFAGVIGMIIFKISLWRTVIFTMIVSAIFCVAWRLIWQTIYLSRFKFQDSNKNKRRVILVGAGDGGSIFMNNFRRKPGNMDVVAILDRDETKIGKVIGGVKVVGDVDLIPTIAERYGVKEIIVAIPSIKPEEYENILQIANPHKLKLYKMPPVEDILQGNHRLLKSTNKVNIADLLGRKEVHLDDSRLRAEIEEKVILITGAGGSIGSEIARQVSRFGPRTVVLLGHGENSIYQIFHELKKHHNMVEYKPVIADVQDYQRIVEVFQEFKPDIIYHAAAHKHVPLMEYNPVEAYKNNVIGTYNVAKAVDACKVSKMVMISTDKAINPPNVMGASKRIAELIITGFDQRSDSNYSAVRFGNVLGSRGSVIPLFEKQIAQGGPVTITDYRMTRYFMTIPEASQLVIYAGAFAKGGEVFVLDMGAPVKILDLAKKLILLSGFSEGEIEIIESGIRPGEKLFEEILTTSEAVSEQVEKDIFIGRVTTMPLEDIESFMERLNQSSAETLKREIVAFANHSIK